MLTIVLLIFLTSYPADNVVETCSCFPAHPQELFCNSEFVIHALITSKARIKSTSKLVSMKSHSLTIIEVFRGNEALHHILMNTDSPKEDIPKKLEYIEANITTPASESLCGIQLNYTESYLIFGQIRNNELQVNMCNFISTWGTVTNQVKSGIYGDYDCSCKIETRMNSKEVDDNESMTEQQVSGGKMQQKAKSSSTCYWEMFPDEPVDECALNFLTCRKLVHPLAINDEQEKCVWVEGRDYELCQLSANIKENTVN